MRRLLLGIALASVTVFAPYAVQAGDQEIATHIEQKLREANEQGALKNFSLDLQVSKGVVWFKGDVKSKEHERLILTTAQRAKHLGVVKIIDEISVAPAQDAATQQIAKKPVLKPIAPPKPVVAPVPQKSQQVAQTQVAPTQVAPTQVAPTQVAQAKTAQSRTEQTQAVGTGARANQQVAQTTQTAAQDQQAARAYYNQQAAARQQVRQTANYTQNQGRVVAPAQQMAAPQQRRPQLPLSAGRPVGRVAQNVMPAVGGAQPANLRAPNYMPVSERRAAAQYDHPQMPNYAWPAYAAHPNYGAVTYPKQYSPSAWPYIGPFYPYPQVPLGWRKVTMEWDDGWWHLDFHDH